mgnify:CR=1 FL=1
MPFSNPLAHGYTAGYTGPGIPDVTRVTNPRQPATNNYLATNYFRLEITRLPTVTYFCQSANLPSLSLTPIEQPTSLGVNPKWIGGKYNFEDFTVSFVVDENMKNWLEVFEWMKDIGTFDGTTIPIDNKQTSDFFSNINIVVTNSVYKPKYYIMFTDAFPIALSGIEFNSTNTENEPAIATATFTYTSYNIMPYTNITSEYS